MRENSSNVYGSTGSVNSQFSINSDSGPGFQFQPDQRKRQARANRIVGSNVLNGRFKGGPEPNRHLFIYRVDNICTESDILVHLKDHEISVIDLKCVSHAESKFKSFKLSVPKSEFSSLFAENMWPGGVCIRPFRERSNREQNYD